MACPIVVLPLAQERFVIRYLRREIPLLLEKMQYSVTE